MDWAIPKPLFPFPLRGINFSKHLFGGKSVSDYWDYLIFHRYEQQFCNSHKEESLLETFCFTGNK